MTRPLTGGFAQNAQASLAEAARQRAKVRLAAWLLTACQMARELSMGYSTATAFVFGEAVGLDLPSAVK
jgi:hypothetical protein